jgi:hypothetical protein
MSAPSDPIDRLLRMAGHAEPISQERAARVKAATHQAWRRSVRRRRLVRLSGLALAAAASVAMAVATAVLAGRRGAPAHPAQVPTAVIGRAHAVNGLVRRNREELRAGEALQVGDRLTTGSDGSATIRLAGRATSLALGPDSAIRWTAARHLVLDTGSLDVDAPPADARSGPAITIRTRFGVVRDRGTRFDLRALLDELHRSVREGRVELERPGRPAETVDAGSELVASSGGTVTRRIPPDGEETRAPFVLDGRSLGAFLRWAAREKRMTLRFQPESLQKRVDAIVVHGSIAGLTPDEALAAVLPTTGLEARPDGAGASARLVVRAAARR